MLKVGMSSCAFPLTEESFKGLKEAGISDIEISLAYDKYEGLDIAAVKKLADQNGVNIWSYHLPFSGPWTCDIASHEASVRSKTVDYWSDLIRKAADVGIDKFVVHPSSEPKPEDSERETFINYSKENLDLLAEFAAKQGAVIAVEDLPRTCLGRTADEIADLISVNDKLRVCFDTNHLLIDDNLSFAEKLGSKIVTIHASDYFFVDECHWLPGEGEVDWHALYNKLVEKGYNGVWMYEVGMGSPKTLTRSRRLDFSDFYNNATEIMTGKPLTVVPGTKHLELF
ncbi:MAG: sugar phosphate isomerase/epimerase [Clostridia bacterium]|nr:sugar phosphate isomerase/epimerase [Clostridia bacterium]